MDGMDLVLMDEGCLFGVFHPYFAAGWGDAEVSFRAAAWSDDVDFIHRARFSSQGRFRERKVLFSFLIVRYSGNVLDGHSADIGVIIGVVICSEW